MAKTRKAHWQHVYRDKQPDEVSWYQPVPDKSLQLIRSSGIDRAAPVLDAGGGASTLVDHLVADGYADISVLDVSRNALDLSRARLGKLAGRVHWIEADVTTFEPRRQYALWHDRAVFHFLVDAVDRGRYLEVVRRALLPEANLVLATFGPEAPERCSGLEICRYSIGSLQQLLEDRFRLRSHELCDHRTPTGTVQQFLYSWWQKLP